MAYPAYIREKARQLRTEKKLTIDELADRLALSRTTVYYWVRDLPLPRRATANGCWPESARRKGNRSMQRKYRLLREEAYAEGRRTFAKLARDPTFRDFVCLYIAEGYKRNRGVVSLANSDPRVVKLAATWMQCLSRNPVTFSFQYHADQNPAVLTAFWCSELGVEADSFRFQRKSNSGQLSGRVWRCRYGVLTVTANDTLLRSRLQGWMDSMQEQWLDSP